jgi:hypothetical protein
MKVATSLVITLALLASLPLLSTAQGPGKGRGGQGRGEGSAGMPPEFQEKIHQLFAHPEKIHRTVDLHAKGYTAETTTTAPELVAALQIHVEQMSGRLGGGQPVRRWDPAFEEFFAHYGDMEHKFTKLDNGIRAEVTGTTPEAITAAHNHARIILDFSSQGNVQMHQPHRTLLDADGGEAHRFRGGPPDARKAKLAETFAARANAASDTLIQTLGGQLKAALEAGGPETALPVCRAVAMSLTEATAQQFADLTITRVTDKPRNPANAADKADLAALDHFRKAAKEPKLLAHITTAEDGKTVRHYRPLVISQVCLKCHGDQGAMSGPLHKQLQQAYPEDQAHGYELGDLRGLIRVESAN